MWVVCRADDFCTWLVEVVFGGYTPSSIGDGVIERHFRCGSHGSVQNWSVGILIVVCYLPLGIPDKDRAIPRDSIYLSASDGHHFDAPNVTYRSLVLGKEDADDYIPMPSKRLRHETFQRVYSVQSSSHVPRSCHEVSGISWLLLDSARLTWTF